MGEKFAIVVAVEKYQDPVIEPVSFAEADAKEFCEALKLHDCTEHNTHLLLSSSATKASIESRFRRILSHLSSDDHFIFFYAGHGFAETDHNYITCFDSQLGDLPMTSISLQKLTSDIRESKCRKAILFLDSCHSGLPIDERMRGIVTSMSEDELDNFFKDSEYHVGFASCKRDQYSYSSPDISHGIWSYHIIEALNGNAEEALERSGLLTANSLQNYLSDAVPRTLRESLTGTFTQNPCVFGNYTKDFVIADLKPILEAKKAAVEPQIAQLKQVIFSGYIEGSVKSLSGFKSYHHIPKEVNDYTEDFVLTIGGNEIKQVSDNLFQDIKDNLRYKRKDVKFSIEHEGSFIICKDFDVWVSLSLNPDDPSEYFIKTEVYNFRNPEIIMSPDFNNAFEYMFNTLTFIFDHRIDVRKVIDKIEALDDETIDITYPGDGETCTISIEGLDAIIEIDKSGLTINRRRKSNPQELAGYFLEIQRQLIVEHSIKELPIGS